MISTVGAFSARLDPDSFLITPHRTDRHDLEPADIVLVRRGRPEEGKTPSSAGRNHQAVYDAHPEVHSVVNAYPVNATAFAVTDASLETRTIPESYIFLRDVPRIPYALSVRRRRRDRRPYLAEVSRPDPRKRRRSGPRDDRPRCLRSPRSPRIDRRGDDQRPGSERRCHSPHARRRHCRTGTSIRARLTSDNPTDHNAANLVILIQTITTMTRPNAAEILALLRLHPLESCHSLGSNAVLNQRDEAVRRVGWLSSGKSRFISSRKGNVSCNDASSWQLRPRQRWV